MPHDLAQRLFHHAPDQRRMCATAASRPHALHILDGIKRAAELAAWEAVPVKVAAIVRSGREIQQNLRTVLRSMPQGDTDHVQVYWRPDKQSIALSFPDGTDEPTKNRWANRLRTLQGVTGVEMDHEWVPQDAVRIKSGSVLTGLGNVWQGANEILGGPTPLTNIVAGGLLGGGLGYMAGGAVESQLPRRQFRRGRFRNVLAAAAALPLVGYGAWKAHANAQLDGNGFMQGLITNDMTPVKAASALLADIEISPEFAKAADNFAQLLGGSGGSNENIKSIPVDAFNQAVWHDVRQGLTAERNPYGTRDAWGDNNTPLHTPQAVGALTTGIMSGIAAQQGGAGWISPGDIVRGLAGAGVGLVSANIAGKALGALAGMRPAAQRQLQTAGAFGGLLMSVVPPLFGR